MSASKRLIIIFTLSVFITGCSEFYSSQPPAPMYGDQAKSQKQANSSHKKTKSRNSSSRENVKIQPLKDSTEIKSELFLSPMPPATELLPIEPTPLVTAEPSLPTPAVTREPSSPTPAATQEPPSTPARGEETPAPVPQEATVFEPMEATARLSPAVGALVSAANQNTKAGDLELAAASIERAIRIEPRNATLFYKLALLRLKQAKPRLAEDLAKKSALLAATDDKLKKHCWLLIAHTREIQQDVAGAKQAKMKADSF